MKNKIVIIAIGTFIGASLFTGVVFAESIKVQKGHTLYNISKKYNTSVEEIKKINGLKSNNISIGQTLKVSNNSTKEKLTTPKVTGDISKAPTHTVNKGDTLFSISKKYGISVGSLQSYNGLRSNTIHIGQILKVSTVEVTTPIKETPSVDVPKSPALPSKDQTSLYTVQRGDTLSSIGRKFNLSFQTIKGWNNLKSDLIYVGQKLSIKNANLTIPTVPSLPKPSNPSKNREQLISYAHSFTGTPYLWGGHDHNGFDCSGYIYHVLKSQNLLSSRTTVAGYWSQALKINNPQAGDLVFFENTYTSGPSHMGIYLGNGSFIHASSKGVKVDNVNSSYYSNHFLGYGTFY